MFEQRNSGTRDEPGVNLIPPPARDERWAFYVYMLFLLALITTAAWILFGDRSIAQETKPEAPLPLTDVSPINEPIQPLPLHQDLDQRKVKLGQRLFADPILSRDQSVSCLSCHDRSHGGGDGKVVATGIGGAQGDINTLSVYNSAYQLAWFWDGRATSLTDQIDGPIHNPKEMGSSWSDVITLVKQDHSYQQAFAQIYHSGVTSENIKNAIATYELSLTTPNSRFDLYLRGNQSAITKSELEGYQLFKDYGCVACHQGENIGGNMFQTFGVAKDYFAERGHITKADLGRYNVTGKEEDRYRFRVPSLRNVELTAPYFHDGSCKTLEEAVRIMGEYQLGRTIPKSDINLIVQFLKTLTGQLPGEGNA